MTTIKLLETGYEWNWLVTLNQFLEGMVWGCGLVFGVCLCLLISKLISRKKKNDTR